MSDSHTDELHERDFRVMGTDARLLLRGDEAIAERLLAEGEQHLHALERRLTRFDPSSELECLNAAGEAVVSGILLELLTAAQHYRSLTSGRFNVGVGARVIAAGYDRTFDSLEPVGNAQRARLHEHMLTHGRSRPCASAAAAAAAAASSVQPPYRIEGTRVTLQPGVRIDLGGIAKGWAADHTARELHERSGASALASLGGDIGFQVVDGDSGWPVKVNLGADGDITIELAFGGLATSGWDGRMWRGGADGSVAHHVIDPLTGEPSVTDIARITVVSSSCMDAEAWAKALLLVGSEAAVAEATELDLTAIIVRADGSNLKTGALAGS